jgi:hypothetical protein
MFLKRLDQATHIIPGSPKLSDDVHCLIADYKTGRAAKKFNDATWSRQNS